MYDEDGDLVVHRKDTIPIAKDLVEHLFSLIMKDRNNPNATAMIQENEFLIRCIMRVFIVIRDAVVPFLQLVLVHLVAITRMVSSNPSNPKFCYYHFEAIGAIIRFSGPTQADTLYEKFLDPFFIILKTPIDEFVPYVFQLVAALIEAVPDPTKPLPPGIQALVEVILQPPVWEQRGNVPALVRLLQAFVARSPTQMIANNQIEPTLGIFQKLLASKAYESYAFDLLETVVASLPGDVMQPFWTPVFQLILTRLQRQQTNALQQRFTRFYHYFSSRDREGLGTDLFLAETDKVQQGIFRELYLGIILPKSQEFTRPLDRKLSAISFVKNLSDADTFVSRYPKGWPLTCQALLKIIEVPPIFPKRTDEVIDNDVEDASFGVGFTQLTTVRRPPRDEFTDMGHGLRFWLARYLRRANERHPNKFETLGGPMSDYLKKVFIAAMAVGEIEDKDRAILGPEARGWGGIP
jgi:exportin-2 (importin alpha re-exporter)